ncbi:MAG TPA: hypothetical protein VGJ96_10550 [Gemmatimonadaceae bacterium]|jgi:hypothetical protein
MTRRPRAHVALAASLLTVFAGTPVIAGAQGLFRRAQPLEVTITTGLPKLVNDRDSTERVLHPAELVYKDSSGNPVKVAVTLRTRGHYRRQFRNCDFPPLRVEVAKEAARKTIFDGNRKLKLATSCRPANADYEQYILQEAAVFRMYTTLTPWSYRVRLARVTYLDADGKAKPITSWGFFVEDDGDLAQRRNAKKFDSKGALFDDLESEKWGYTQLFEYMIGNTDFSVSGLHNITLLRDSIGTVHAVPYDFDWSGAVNTRYSFPDKSLPIRMVTERLWRGDCRPVELLTPTIDHFKERRAALDSAYSTIDAMTPVVRERMRKYFAEFWSLMDNPKRAAAEFKRTCSAGN